MRPLRHVKRATVLVWAFPDRYVEPDSYWEGFKLYDWSASKYEWVDDPWRGYLDSVQDPFYTVASGTGDCDDYALVALHWASANDRPDPGIAVMGYKKWGAPIPNHVVAYDAERVYDSGHVVEQTPAEYVEAREEYDWVLCRGLYNR